MRHECPISSFRHGCSWGRPGVVLEMGLDLHTHSTASDGSLTPGELVLAAKRRGLDGLALTDHDSVEGLDEAIRVGTELEFPVVPGIELTTDFGDEEVHILGYGIQWRRLCLREKLERIIASREERARGMVERLKRAGIHLSWEAVRAGTSGKFIGRPHIYHAMKESGLIGEDPLRKSFEYYLGKHGVAYLPHQEIGTFEAVELIRSVEGIPVLAHPGRMTNLSILPKLCQHGLAGLEVYYPSHTPSQIRRFCRSAKRYGLLLTGGSDYHGSNGRTELGEAQAPTELLNQLRSNG